MKHSPIIKYLFSQYPKNMDLSHANTFYHKDLQRKVMPNRVAPKLDAKNLVFGGIPSQHMITIDYKEQKWEAPLLSQFKMLEIHPFNSTLHYGITCYQGLKAYKNQKGQIRLFRPECNMSRFKKSSTRASLPDFDGAELLKVLEEFVHVEEQFIPPYKGFSLYLRPFHISMQRSLGVKSPSQSQIMIIASPVGPYYPTGFNPISLFCDTKNVRSAPKGTGGYKLGGNYGPTILLSNQAAKKGHQQVLWLFNNKVGQVGSSNIFFVLTDPKTKVKKVITPTLEDLVLPGVTRDSIILLLKHKGIEVEQRIIMIDQVCQKMESGEITQIFGAGTAVIVSPVKAIQYNQKSYPLKLNQQYKSGELTYQIFNHMLDIQEGRKLDPFGWSKVIKR